MVFMERGCIILDRAHLIGNEKLRALFKSQK